MLLNRGCLHQHGKALKSLQAKSGNGMAPNEPYLGIRGLLEFGGGVHTSSLNLKFRNLLKSTIWQFEFFTVLLVFLLESTGIWAILGIPWNGILAVLPAKIIISIPAEFWQILVTGWLCNWLWKCKILRILTWNMFCTVQKDYNRGTKWEPSQQALLMTKESKKSAQKWSIEVTAHMI